MIRFCLQLHAAALVLSIALSGALSGCSMNTNEKEVEVEATSDGITLSDGMYIHSDQTTNLVLTAWLYHGAPVRLEETCGSGTYPGLCFYNDQWQFKDGMIVAVNNPEFAMTAGAWPGAQVTVSSSCTPSDPNCTWTLANGLFYSNTGFFSLAINALDGAIVHEIVQLADWCSASDPTCTWTIPSTMIAHTSNNFAWNAPGVGHGSSTWVSLDNSCAPWTTTCRWRISHGEIRSVADPNDAVAPYSGSTSAGASIAATTGCSPSTPACTWLIGGGVFYNGANWGAYIEAPTVSQGTNIRFGGGSPGSPGSLFTAR